MEVNDNNSAEFTEQGQTIVALSKAMFAGDMETVFEVIGKYMDENNLQISEKVILEFKSKGRISAEG
ncbi:MAG: hypothetical protein GY927_18735 [bacterium]|nr:hypothetical protein [bacterium]